MGDMNKDFVSFSLASELWHAREGVTGQRESTESRVEGLIQQLHQITDKSVAVGFGVSGPEQVVLSPLPLPQAE
jgi:hypothetical protein